MRFGYIRAIAYTAVIFGTALALTFVPALPDSRPADVMFTQAASPSWKLRFDTLGKGESLQRVLRRGGLSDTAAIRAIQSASNLDERKIPAGMPVTIRSVAADSAPSEVLLHLDIDHVIHLKRTGTSWKGVEERLPWTTDTIIVAGTIQTNLYAAVDQSATDFLPSAARIRLTNLLADVYESKVDMSRDLQKGDEFKVAAERLRGPNGAVKIDHVLATSFSLSGSVIKAVRFNSASVNGDFFDQDGKSMREAFLRAPLKFERISSVFGLRQHPILGDMRKHQGTDYAAASGTPVRAIGDGTVIRAEWGNGYGNMIEIRHPNGYITRYGHMRNFVKGMHAGTRVKIGETIGFVGATGLATGPHLHFEVLVNGEQRDSRTAFKRAGGDPIPTAERTAFQGLRDQLLVKLDAVHRNVATTLNAAVSGR